MSATTLLDRRTAGVLPAILALGGGLLLLGLVFLPECRAALRVWTDSTAYGHCYLVAPIAAYLAWDRRDTLRGLMPRPTPAFALLGMPFPLAWFAAERLGIMEGRQLVAVAFVELLFLVVLGWRLFRALSGPLLYLFFLVPFGAFLTPLLQSFTARFIEVGLTVLGIPHFVNDMLIEISAGTFFVAEACAGLRFLIASVAFGVFYALLNYRSPRRRAAFIAASIIVPIVANGIRALGIVVLGSFLGSAEAAAADHLIYGWVFFSFVMLLLVAAGLPLREAPAPPRQAAHAPFIGPAPQPWPALLVLLLAAIAPGASFALDRNAAPPTLSGPLAFTAPDGCTASATADAGPGRTTQLLHCEGRDWLVTVQGVPPRSTGAALSEARGRLIGPIDADDMTATPLRNAPPDGGSWQVIVSRKPTQVTAISAWVHGAPAAGGLSQRLHQARDSVFGNDVPPLLIAVATRPDHRLPEREMEAAVTELASIVAAQPGLAARVAAITRPR